jgi:hypothetical protein
MTGHLWHFNTLSLPTHSKLIGLACLKIETQHYRRFANQFVEYIYLYFYHCYVPVLRATHCLLLCRLNHQGYKSQDFVCVADMSAHGYVFDTIVIPILLNLSFSL